MNSLPHREERERASRNWEICAKVRRDTKHSENSQGLESFMQGARPGLLASVGSGRAEGNKGWTGTEDMLATKMSNQAFPMSIGL